jgi:dipeptide/tripeptide permease
MTQSTESAPEKTILGHPRGLFVLFFAELWERFCYYGMRALLAVYVAEQFTQGDRSAASGMYGAFTALVYALGFFGGTIADKYLGYRRAIIVGGVLMAAGEFMLMIPTEEMFLMGLAVLIVGNGLFKPNISTMVGKLYKQGDARRDGGFTIFYMGINLGAFLAPIVCRWVAGVMGTGGKPDYRWGFIAAGIGMLLGVVTFWRGFAALGDKGLPPKGREGVSSILVVIVGGLALAPAVYMLLAKAELAGYVTLALLIGILLYLVWYGLKSDKVTFQRILALIILLIGNIAFWASFEQAGNSLNFFARDQVKWESTDNFPLGGTRGELKSADAQSVTLPVGFARALDGAKSGSVNITVTYPSPENVNIKVDATAELASGEYLPDTPLAVALADNDKKPRNQDIANAMANWEAAKTKFAAAVAKHSADQTDPAAKQEFDEAQTLLKKSSVEFVIGPVREFEWFQSVNAIFIVLLGPLFSALWVWLDRRNANPSIPFKFGLGLVQVGLGFALLVWSFKGADANGLVPWYMLTGLYLIHTLGELCISPVGLSMVTKLAPPTITGFVMGGWFLSIANANFGAALFSSLAGGGEHGEAPATGTAALVSYQGAYMPIIYMSIGVGVLFLLLAKPIDKLMHGIK